MYTYANFKFLDYIDVIDFVDFIKVDPLKISDFFCAGAAVRLSVWQPDTCGVYLRLVNHSTTSMTILCSTCTSCLT